MNERYVPGIEEGTIINRFLSKETEARNLPKASKVKRWI